VGILWNGGGAGACQTMHRSAYDNAAELFAQAAVLIDADLDRMVFQGGSRGGTTSLAVASNPYHTGYRARFVIANNPQSFPGEALERFANPTYGLVHSTMPDVTGYEAGWMEDWTHHVTGQSNEDIAMHVLLGSSDPAFIDANLANGSDPHLDQLVARDTRVIMRVGTHDYSRSFTHQARLYERMVAKGIPVRMEIGYRFGHGFAVGTQPDALALLLQVFANDDGLATGLVHYRKASVVDYDTGVPFTPTHQPFLVEAPILTGMDQTHTWAVVGAPGTPWEVRMAKIDEQILFSTGQVVPYGPLTPLLSGTLPATGGELAWDAIDVDVPVAPGAEGVYTYELRYTVGGTQYTVGSGGGAPPTYYPEEPLFLLWTSELLGWADESRTGGIASDPIF